MILLVNKLTTTLDTISLLVQTWRKLMNFRLQSWSDLTHNSAIGRCQILGGHTVNRDIRYWVYSYINLKILGGHVPVCPPYEYGPAQHSILDWRFYHIYAVFYKSTNVVNQRRWQSATWPVSKQWTVQSLNALLQIHIKLYKTFKTRLQFTSVFLVSVETKLSKLRNPLKLNMVSVWR